MNGEYIKKMDAEEFYEKALPYMKEVLKKDYDFRKIAGMVQTRIETFPDIPELVDFFEEVPEYDSSMYCHKKMKTTEETSLTVLKEVLPVLEAHEDYTNDPLFAVLSAFVKDKEMCIRDRCTAERRQYKVEQSRFQEEILLRLRTF